MYAAAKAAKTEIREMVHLLNRKREAAVSEANAFAISVAALDESTPRSVRLCLELIERMYSHNVAVFDDVLQDLRDGAFTGTEDVHLRSLSGC